MPIRRNYVLAAVRLRFPMDAGPPGSEAAVTTAPECGPVAYSFAICSGCRGANRLRTEDFNGHRPPPSQVSTPRGSPPRSEGIVAVVLHPCRLPVDHMLTS
jgi:hypothetical protein